MKKSEKVTIVVLFAFGISPAIFADEALSRALIEAGDRFMEQNRYTEAAAAFRSAAARAGGSAEMGASLDRLGVACAMLGRDAEAEMAYRRAIAILKSSEGERSPLLIRAWMDLAGLYLTLGRYDSAHDLAEKALTALTRQASPDTAATAMVLTLLAAIDVRLHNPKDAEARFRKAMAVLDSAGRTQSHEWIGAANNLGVILILTGRPEEGRVYLREALSFGQTVLRTDAERLVLGQVLVNLFRIDFALRHFDEAEKNLRRGLEIYETYLGPTDRLTGDIFLQYAALCRATKRKAETKDYERRAKKCLSAGAYASVANTVDIGELQVRRGKSGSK